MVEISENTIVKTEIRLDRKLQKPLYIVAKVTANFELVNQDSRNVQNGRKDNNICTHNQVSRIIDEDNDDVGRLTNMDAHFDCSASNTPRLAYRTNLRWLHRC